MKNRGMHHKASDILANRSNSFRILWPDEEPDKPDHHHSKNEYKGLYAFAVITKTDVNWQYIGISQTIKRRFKGHRLRKSKNTASWAYMMVKSEAAIPEIQKKRIYPCHFTFVQIENNMFLHMAEVYCVNKRRSERNNLEGHKGRIPTILLNLGIGLVAEGMKMAEFARLTLKMYIRDSDKGAA